MKLRFRTIVCLMFAGTVYGTAQEPVRLDGTWSITSIAVNGRVNQGTGQISLRFAGDAYEQVINGDVTERGSITLDPTKKPMTIDFIITEGAPPGTVQLGIIDVAGDAMKLQVNLGTDVRPSDFNPSPETFLIVATRNKGLQ